MARDLRDSAQEKLWHDREHLQNRLDCKAYRHLSSSIEELHTLKWRSTRLEKTFVDAIVYAWMMRHGHRS